MSKKLTTAMKIAKCADKLFDSLVEEKLLDKDNEIVANIRAAKDSFKKTVESFNAQEKTEKKKEKKTSKKSKTKGKTKVKVKVKAPTVSPLVEAPKI